MKLWNILSKMCIFAWNGAQIPVSPPLLLLVELGGGVFLLTIAKNDTINDINGIIIINSSRSN